MPLKFSREQREDGDMERLEIERIVNTLTASGKGPRAKLVHLFQPKLKKVLHYDDHVRISPPISICSYANL